MWSTLVRMGPPLRFRPIFLRPLLRPLLQATSAAAAPRSARTRHTRLPHREAAVPATAAVLSTFPPSQLRGPTGRHRTESRSQRPQLVTPRPPPTTPARPPPGPSLRRSTALPLQLRRMSPLRRSHRARARVLTAPSTLPTLAMDRLVQLHPPTPTSQRNPPMRAAPRAGPPVWASSTRTPPRALRVARLPRLRHLRALLAGRRAWASSTRTLNLPRLPLTRPSSLP